MSLTHCHQYHQIMPPRIWWQLTCISLSCSLAICGMTNLVFMWRHLSITYLLMNFCNYLSFYMKATYLPVHLLPFNFPIPICSLTKIHTQKCGNFPKTSIMTLFHVQWFSYLKTFLNNVYVSKWDFECDPHWSADLTQRSRLFICVETNSWCMLLSSIASAVFWVNSAQFFSGKSMSMRQHYSYFSGRNPLILTFQSHICLGRTFSIQNFRKINFLKSDFSNFLGSLPLIFILCISQVDKFIGNLTIKFSEYNHQRNCKGHIY